MLPASSITRILALAAFAVLLATAFRKDWNEPSIDLSSASAPAGVIRFELVAYQTSTAMWLDPLTRSIAPVGFTPRVSASDSITSPDGRWTAHTETSGAAEHLWVKDLATGHDEELAGRNCNSGDPAWELDSSAVIFASDCGRALGLPALYRAPISRHTPETVCSAVPTVTEGLWALH
jgi:hypothetical protein